MATPPLHTTMRALLEQRASRSALRALRTAPSSSIDFSSNDFLSLSTSTFFKTAYLEELTSTPDFRIGSGGSRLLDGNSLYAEQLERDVAAFHGAEAGLLFNSGFDANAGFFSCVPQPGDVIFYDEQIHASVHDGMRLSRAGIKVSFVHNSVEDLQKRLVECIQRDALIRKGQRNIFVAVEALYSMDGDLAPIKGIMELVEQLLPDRNGHVVVDEAHSNGVYGFQGRGIVCSLGLESRVFARLHTFGKGLACSGGLLHCFLGFPQADWASHDPLFAIDSGIPHQLCETIDIYNLDVIPFFGCHQSGILSHEARSNPTCEYSIA
jgi:8-amino-7-oxononanoate synthase